MDRDSVDKKEKGETNVARRKETPYDRVLRSKLVWTLPLLVVVGALAGYLIVGDWLIGFVVGMLFALALAVFLAQRATDRGKPEGNTGKSGV